jgi:long-chain acyl-CoA synthetase
VDPRFRHFPTLVHVLAEAVAHEPKLPALICQDRRISYREFGRAAAGMADELARFSVAGERVAIMMPNSIETVVAIMAAVAAHAQVSPVNPFFTEHELEPILRIADPRVLLCDATTIGKGRALASRIGIRHIVLVGPGGWTLERWTQRSELKLAERHLPESSDLALLIFTGGTTGVPKGVDHTHAGLTYSMVLHCSVWPVEFGRERFLTVTPMFHIWGLGYAAWVPMYARSPLVIVPKYEPDAVITALAEHHVTVFGGGPAPVYTGLLRSPLMASADLSSLKYCLSGGAPCPEELHRSWEKATGCPLFEGWGMTEGAPFCLNPAHGVRKVLSIGLPVPDTEVQAVDLETGTRVLPDGEAGELRVRGPQVTRGYRNNPAETAIALRDGWLYTGDIGYRDQDGYFFIVDRKKEMVIVGGYNVYPRQVDEVLYKHPKIQEAATVGRPDPDLGEVIVAFVVLKAGETMSEDEFFSYCKQEMVKYKRPVDVHFIDALPRTGASKINKLQLKRQALAAPTATHSAR